MSSAVIAIGAVSPLGRGTDAFRVAFEGAPARVAVGHDAALASAGLARPSAARAALARDPRDDHATTLLSAALADLVAALDQVRPGWRSERACAMVGTSSGGMLSAESFFAAREAGLLEQADQGARALAHRATYFAPLTDALERSGLGELPRVHLLAACAASTLAMGLAHRALEQGLHDVVLAGGYDALSVFVAAGFEGLRATTETTCRPFRRERDGMSLGEGAGLVALVRSDDLRGARALFHVRGFGVTNDAVHPTAPDRTGGGLARAASRALATGGLRPADVALVSAHGSATPFNDAMESRAIAAVFGVGSEGAGGGPVVHPMKAQIGHTLGAAGVLELLGAMDAAGRRLAPAAAGAGELDPDAPARLEPVTRAMTAGEGDGVLKLSAAFGGTNAALALSTESGSTEGGTRPQVPTRRAVYALRAAKAERADLGLVERVTGTPIDRMSRFDEVCRLGATAVARLAEALGPGALEGAGIVAGHALATLDTNEAFDSKKRSRGPRFVVPRAFPATSPNVVAGECAVLFRLTGPGFAVGGGLSGALEALSVASLLVATGECERVVVLGVDDLGPVSLDLLRLLGCTRPFATGAVALLVGATPPSPSRAPLPFPVPFDHALGPVGHLALLDAEVDWA